jgi:ATP-binding cassette subfamily B protein
MTDSGDRLLVTLARRDPVRLPLMALTALAATTVGLLLPGALAAAVDSAVAGRLSGPDILRLVVIGVAEIVANIVGGLLAVTVTSRTTARLRRALATHLLALGTRSGFADGDAISRLIGDAGNAGAIAALAVQLVTSALLSGGAIVLLAVLDPWLAVVFLLSVPLAALLARGHLRATADDALRYREVSGELAARLLDAVAGLRTIAAAGIAEQETQRVLRPLPGLGIAGRGIWRTQARMVWRAELLLPAVELAVLVTAGFGLMNGRLSVGEVLAALGYVALGMAVVGQIPVLSTLSSARGSAARIAEVLATPARPGRIPDSPRENPRLAPGKSPTRPGALRLVGVGVGRAEAPALAEVELTVPGGAFVAVVGRSGAGKSVLVGVLGGLITPDRGVALLDDVPLPELVPSELRAAVAYAFERPALIGATVADAIGYGTTAADSEIEQACRAARVHDLLVRLPDGYRTALAATPLSGGEAQRVGLARALVRRPRVLILDDATASLDTVTEAQVLASVPPDCTRVVVSHRASVAAGADLVVWLDGGRVRAVAPHDVLWADPGYRGVFQS